MNGFDRDYFENLYARGADPWNFSGSPYERAKYDATLAALPRRDYASALEPGCSIGVLTRRLAGVAGKLLALDTSERALGQARDALADQPHVAFMQAHLPEGEWDGRYDLIVLSEVLYYLAAPALDMLARRLRQVACADADIIAVHWTGPTDYPLTADAAVARFRANFGPLQELQHHRHAHYRLDLWRAP